MGCSKMSNIMKFELFFIELLRRNFGRFFFPHPLLFPSMYLVPLLNFIYANWADTTRGYVENSEKRSKDIFLLFYIPYMWYFCFFIQRRFFSRITFPSNVPQQTQLQFLKIGQNVNFCICLGLRYTALREWFKNVRM